MSAPAIGDEGFTPPSRSAEHGFESSSRSAEHGFESSLRSAEHGFTLIEMLVALTIFALIAAAGVMLLRASVDTQMAVAQRLSGESGMNRLRALLGADLASAQPRPWRDDSGRAMPAFIGGANQIQFVEAADAGPGHSGLKRVRYALANGAIVRTSPLHVDGGAEGPPAALLNGVTAAHWRFRSVDGAWSEGWAADMPERLPRAVELTIERRGGPPVTLAFLVAPDGLPPPGTPPEPEPQR